MLTLLILVLIHSLKVVMADIVLKTTWLVANIVMH